MQEIHFELSNKYVDVEAKVCELAELDESMSKLEAEILEVTPSSLEGIISMLDMYWEMFGPDGIVGTQSWREGLEAPKAKLLLQIRNGANQLVA